MGLTLKERFNLFKDKAPILSIIVIILWIGFGIFKFWSFYWWVVVGLLLITIPILRRRVLGKQKPL